MWLILFQELGSWAEEEEESELSTRSLLSLPPTVGVT